MPDMTASTWSLWFTRATRLLVGSYLRKTTTTQWYVMVVASTQLTREKNPEARDAVPDHGTQSEHRSHD